MVVGKRNDSICRTGVAEDRPFRRLVEEATKAVKV